MDRQKIERAGTFVLGGVAGAVFGILISPRSGREVRGGMSSRAGEARQRGREGYFEARERARERLAAMREPRTADDAGEMVFGGPLPEEAPSAGPIPDDPEPRPGLRAVPPEEPETSAEETPETSESSETLRLRIIKTRERLRGPGGGSDG